MVPKTVNGSQAIDDQRRSNRNCGTWVKAEWPGILAWAIQGCLNWRRIGLAPPSVIRVATEAYLAGEDSLTQWLDECCAQDRIYTERVTRLFASWKSWAEAAREPPGSQKRFSQALASRGFERGRSSENLAVFLGLALKPGLV